MDKNDKIEGVEITNLIKLFKSDSVYILLRYAVKNPFKSGVDNCKDDDYYTLYEIIKKLRIDKLN